MKIKIPQQSVNLLRGILGAPQWATTPQHVYLAGEMLVKTLPELDTSWVKMPEQLSKLTVDETRQYAETDKAWCSKIIEVSVSEKQKEAIYACLKKHGHHLPVNSFSVSLLKAFGFGEE